MLIIYDLVEALRNAVLVIVGDSHYNLKTLKQRLNTKIHAMITIMVTLEIYIFIENGMLSTRVQKWAS